MRSFSRRIKIKSGRNRNIIKRLSRIRRRPRARSSNRAMIPTAWLNKDIRLHVT